MAGCRDVECCRGHRTEDVQQSAGLIFQIRVSFGVLSQDCLCKEPPAAGFSSFAAFASEPADSDNSSDSASGSGRE